MPEDEDEFRPTDEEIEQAGARIQSLDEATRKIGVYLDNAILAPVPTSFGPRLAIFAEFTIGDVAFTQRVQDPEQAQIDRMFKEMTHGFGTDEFLDQREQIKKRIAEGRSIFDRGDDGEDGS